MGEAFGQGNGEKSKKKIPPQFKEKVQKKRL